MLSRKVLSLTKPKGIKRNPSAIILQFNPSTVKVILWYLWPDAPVPWSTAGSEVNMLQSSHYYFSKFHMWNFLHVRLHSPHTHILQIILQDKNSWKKKTQKEITWTVAKNKILIRRRPSPYVTLAQANYYLNLFYIIFARLAILTYVHHSTIRMHLSSSQTQQGPL